MSDLRPRENSWFIVNALRQWWQNWRGANSRLTGFICCGDGEVERMARDLGLPVSELRRIAEYGPEAADLLMRRMAALDLDKNEIAAAEPHTLQDLQRHCTLCESHRQCARDLRRDPGDSAWEDYCPNVAMLKLLDSLPWAARGEW
jgi:hypothetical protein